MSNSDPSLDELVSAYIDGEATDDEVARVESDPALLARANQFRGLAGIVAQAPAPPVDSAPARESAIAAALAASGTTEKVTSIAPKQAARPRFSANAALMSAAAVLFVVLGGFALLNGVGGGDDVATDAVSDTESASDAAGNIAGSADTAGGDDSGLGDSMGESAAESAMSAEAMSEDDAMEEEAMEDDGAMEEADEAMEEEAGDSDDSGADESAEAPAEDATDAAEPTQGRSPTMVGEISELADRYSPELVAELLAANKQGDTDLDTAKALSRLTPICGDNADLLDRLDAFELIDVVEVEATGEIIQVFVDPDTAADPVLVFVDPAGCAEVSP